MKKKILLVSYLFAPEPAIGALRPAKWVKVLTKNGFEVDVVTLRGESVPDGCAHRYSMKSAAFDDEAKKGRKKFANSPAKVFLRRRLGRLWIKMASVRTHLSDLKSGMQFLRFVKALDKTKLQGSQYDLMITSFGPVASLFAGLYLKKRHPALKWFCDFRDPILRKATPLIFKPLFFVLQKEACRRADRIAVVSRGNLKEICRKKKFAKKATLIPNGFDEEDLPQKRKGQHHARLQMAYTGKLYRGRSDLSPLFRALKELSEGCFIDIKKVALCYAGKDYDVIRNQAIKYRMDGVLENRGFISRKESVRLQSDADLLILATWNTKGDEGVLTGKFSEYIMTRKPIVALTSGDLADGEVTRIIREGKFGIAYESSRDGQDFPALKKYIQTQYDNVIAGNEIPYSPKEAVRERFNYKTIGGEIVKTVLALSSR